jgi:integrase/recombinase XerD
LIRRGGQAGGTIGSFNPFRKEPIMTPLRQRMLEDMRMRNLSTGTQASYVRAVARFAQHFGRSPEVLGYEQVREYLLYLIEERRVSWSTYNLCRSALQFVYRVTLGRDGPIDHIPCARNQKRLPVVLSQAELRRFFAATENPRHKAIFLTAYGTGMRVSELVALRPEDIDGGRMLIRVRQGKGKKDRCVKLSPFLLGALRDYYRCCRPEGGWLFPGRGGSQMSRVAVTKAADDIGRRAGLGKRIGAHTFRHTYATHMLDAGADLATIQALMGHGSLRTTSIYLHVSNAKIDAAPSPLDLMFAPPTAPKPTAPKPTQPPAR